MPSIVCRLGLLTVITFSLISPNLEAEVDEAAILQYLSTELSIPESELVDEHGNLTPQAEQALFAREDVMHELLVMMGEIEPSESEPRIEEPVERAAQPADPADILQYLSSELGIPKTELLDQNGNLTPQTEQALAEREDVVQTLWAMMGKPQQSANPSENTPAVQEQPQGNPVVSERGTVSGLSSLRQREPMIPSSELVGAAVKYSGGGELRYDFMTQLAIVTPPTLGTYLILKDRSVVYTPGAPSDFDLNTYKQYLHKSDKTIATLDEIHIGEDDIYPPHPRGYTLDVYAEDNKPGIGGPTMKSLTLNRDGTFKISSLSMLAGPDFGDGNFGRSVNGNDNTGAYFIDGNTIELQLRNGTTVRKLFGTDGTASVLLGDSLYLVKRR